MSKIAINDEMTMVEVWPGYSVRKGSLFAWNHAPRACVAQTKSGSRCKNGSMVCCSDPETYDPAIHDLCTVHGIFRNMEEAFQWNKRKHLEINHANDGA